MSVTLRAKGTCRWCRGPLPKGRRLYCSDPCGDTYYREVLHPLDWPVARQKALERAGGRCEECGTQNGLDVHHVQELGYENRFRNEKNRQENLVVLCRRHHHQAHQAPRSPWSITIQTKIAERRRQREAVAQQRRLQLPLPWPA